MLVLSRKLNQKIRIGENVTVEVVRIRNGAVRLGITAPADVQVDRDEVRKVRKVCGGCGYPAGDPCGLCVEDIQRLGME